VVLPRVKPGGPSVDLGNTLSRPGFTSSLTALSAPLIGAAALLAAPASQAAFWIPLPPAAKQPAHSKRLAERNVLLLVPRGWNAQARSLGLINARSNLLENNVQAVCRGRGQKIGTRYHRFGCVVRPWPRKGRAGLYLTYRAEAGERFHVSLIQVRRR
jgi:hypothetical protein